MKIADAYTAHFTSKNKEMAKKIWPQRMKKQTVTVVALTGHNYKLAK